VSEEQLEALMSRPVMRQLSPRASLAARTRAAEWRAGAAVAVCALLILAVGVRVLWPVPPAGAPAPAASDGSRVLPLPTAAAFTVAIGSSDSSEIALGVLRARELGLPAFTETLPGQSTMKAAVGPYASLDEAVGVRNQLAGAGLSGLALTVDDDAPLVSRAGIDNTGGSGSAVRLVRAHGRLSLALDLTAEPRFVNSRRASPSTFEVEIGPLARSISPRRWKAPQGVHLLRQVSLEERSSAAGRNVVVSLELPESVTASVRSAGRRLYIDVGSPLEPVPDLSAVAALSRVGNHATPGEPDLATEPGTHAEDSYHVGMEGLRRRMAEVQPFVTSAARSNSDDVSRAVDQTLAALVSSLEAIPVPVSERASHDRLLAAIREARRALEPGFVGDRLAQAEQAAALFDLALAPLASC
jgi:hypothetical protein